MDDVTFNQKVGGEWVGEGGKLIQGMYWVKSFNYQTSWQRGIATCQDTSE